MEHIYLSPHFDDAVWSCGGAIAAQTGQGDLVKILTICAGEPQDAPLSPIVKSLHDRWEAGASPVAIRREEDQQACALVGAQPLRLDYLDAIYRVEESGTPFYSQEGDIFGSIHPADVALAQEISAALDVHLKTAERVYCPIGIGGHVDHQLVRAAAEIGDRILWYYWDMPYAAQGWETPEWISIPDGRAHLIALSDQQAEVWTRAAAQYASQISTFWDSARELRTGLLDYLQDQGGIPVIEGS